MTLAVVVVFLNEERFLPVLLDSIARQTRPPDQLLLVDDGSHDASREVARAFAEEHAYARALERPQRPRETDRLATAAELKAFHWGVEQLAEPYDIVVKLDGDLELPPRCFERILSAFADDPRLGIAGAPLSTREPGGAVRPERSAPWHVRGPNKFYRRECWRQISPLPEILGWDAIDEARAQMNGWRIAVVPIPGARAVHLRSTGTYDGALRGFRRRGIAAWAYGAHPAGVLASAAVRIGDPPRLRGALAYLGGWLRAAVQREPRAEREVLRFVRRQNLKNLRASVLARIR
jgi:biofilm PGA synthesis N-glycosyltransferase PgaC